MNNPKIGDVYKDTLTGELMKIIAIHPSKGISFNVRNGIYTISWDNFYKTCIPVSPLMLYKGKIIFIVLCLFIIFFIYKYFIH